MTGFVRKATLLGVLGLFAASAAFASVPDPAHSTVGPWLRVVGYTSGGAKDASGQYCVVIRDFANNPISGVSVTLDLSNCCDIAICNDGGIVGFVGCLPPKVTLFTDASGTACFTVLGTAKDAGTYVQPNATNGAKTPCVRLTAGTVDFGLVANALALDQDGLNTTNNVVLNPGTTTSDLGKVIALITANNQTGHNGTQYRTRANYFNSTNGEGSPDINSADLGGCITEITRANTGVGTKQSCGHQVSPGGSTAPYCTGKVAGPNCPS